MPRPRKYEYDPVFNPHAERANDVSVHDTTPTLRPEDRNAEAARSRVKDVDPNNGRCHIEHVPEGANVEYAHYFPWCSTNKDELMDNIEWWWNMPYLSLNVDTRDNVFPLGASLHRLFDRGAWVLLPQMDIVKQYHDTIQVEDEVLPTGRTIQHRFIKREDFPQIQRGIFKYNFVSFRDNMQGRSILRQLNHVSTPTEADYKVYPHPFKALPVLDSHLHPKFVILASGSRIRNYILQLADEAAAIPGSDDEKADRRSDAIRAATEELRQRDPRLPLLATLAAFWTEEHPENVMNDDTYNVPLPDDSKSDSHTAYGRSSSKRKYPNVDGDGSPKRAKSKTSKSAKNAGGSNKQRKAASLQLSGKTLYQVDHVDKATLIDTWVTESQARYHEMDLDVPAF